MHLRHFLGIALPTAIAAGLLLFATLVVRQERELARLRQQLNARAAEARQLRTTIAAVHRFELTRDELTALIDETNRRALTYPYSYVDRVLAVIHGEPAVDSVFVDEDFVELGVRTAERAGEVSKRLAAKECEPTDSAGRGITYVRARCVPGRKK